jgi:hypothetical protein
VKVGHAQDQGEPGDRPAPLLFMAVWFRKPLWTSSWMI